MPWNCPAAGAGSSSAGAAWSRDRQLAGARLEQRALAAEDVAEVPVLEGVVHRVAEAVPGDEELDPAAAGPVEPSCSVQNAALPITRFNIMRPATLTFAPSASSSSAVRPPLQVHQLVGVVRGL